MASLPVAQAYVKDKLGVEFVPDKSLLLNNIIRAFFEKMPHQNISTSVLPAADRFPSEKNVLETAIGLKGGLNVHSNWFFKLLLESLDYKVHFVAARLYVPPSSAPRPFGSHFAVVVSDLEKPGDRHLVDVGSGSPVFKAVPLNRLPYTATDVTLTYRFVEADGQWHNEHKADGEQWQRFASYDETPVAGSPADAFGPGVLDYLNEDRVSGSLIAVHYPQPGSTAIPDVPDFDRSLDYAVYIINDRVTLKNSSGFTWSEPVPEDRMVRAFEDHFPNIPKADVERKLAIASAKAAACPKR